MGILTDAAPIILICTRDVPRTAAFYRDVLGLTAVSEDKHAAVFTVGRVMLRVSLVPDFVVNGHTVMGFQVQNLVGAIRALREKGVVFHRPQRLTLDDDGIWTVPGGLGQVAWLADPEGNMVSITTV
jgi:catechol 2,3-dioxygenase-like lactoylglutathione lyase family enzyme